MTTPSFTPSLPLGSRRIHQELTQRAVTDARAYVQARTHEYPHAMFHPDVLDWIEPAEHRVRDLEIPFDAYLSDTIFKMAWAAAAAVEAARVIETLTETPYDAKERARKQARADREQMERAARDMLPTMADLGEGNRG